MKHLNGDSKRYLINRKFSIPYNGDFSDKYIRKVILPYKKYIDSVFFGLPSLLDTHPRFEDKDIAERNTLNFLSCNISIKRFLTLNKAHYWKSDKEIFEFCDKMVFPIVEKYSIEGIIVSDFTMAKYIHKYMPNVELSTSCNTFSYNVCSMRLWQKECGVSLFNPPRDILRTPNLLREMSNRGFKLKCIVNESCRYGCTQQMTHCFCGNNIHGKMSLDCKYLDDSGILKCNWVLPRWLKYLDEYVSVYKIVGRGETTERILLILDSYINERNDGYIDDFIYGGAYRGKHYNLPVKIVPDKLLTCMCMECGNSCNLCDKVVQTWKQTIF